MKKTRLFILLALMLMGSTGAVKAQSVTGEQGGAATHNDQFFTGKAVTVDLSAGGSVKLTATAGCGGENTYSVVGEGLTLKLSSTPVEPVQVINPTGAEATYNVGTHVAGSALDFSGIEQNMTAYVATEVNGTKGTLTLAKATAIKSGDAFVMRADEKGWYCIPVGGSADYDANLFKGNATASTPLGSNTYYALHKSGVFAKINTASVTAVPAGKAYLEVTGNGTQSLAFVFDGDNDNATAIDNVNADDNLNANVNANLNNAYNLSGQRVSKGYKGIVIVNGKKIMLNN